MLLKGSISEKLMPRPMEKISSRSWTKNSPVILRGWFIFGRLIVLNVMHFWQTRQLKNGLQAIGFWWK
ncbi:hypothetical protein CR513_55447 [Mucuna pruriens]|uniref:Uncharacterized protein n=1 Tax=Mucuna pruriens TaxID=157652 RepID=A0A371EIH8_MUCPR|nr:hypothetical protein CR513_55447 [Mucuna pruriens]